MRPLIPALLLAATAALGSGNASSVAANSTAASAEVTPTARPVVTIRGPKRLVTSRSQLTLSGTVSSNPDQVIATIGGPRNRHRARPAIGTSSWHFTFPLHHGYNSLNVRAYNSAGSSLTASVIVTRR